MCLRYYGIIRNVWTRCVGISSNIQSAGNENRETRENKKFSNHQRKVSKGQMDMSIISLYGSHSFDGTSKHWKVTTSSLGHDYFTIMAISSIFLGVVLITMLMGPVLITSSTGLSMNEISDCRKKIISSEQMGYYSSPEQFRLAESYCYIR